MSAILQHGRDNGSFENEALENEDRSTKHPKLENEAPKTAVLDRVRTSLAERENGELMTIDIEN